MAKTNLKTITLCTGDNPSVVICPGHVSAKVFNQAFGNEWKDKGNYKQKEMSYVYAVTKDKKKGTVYKQVAPDTKGCKKYTWCHWD